MRFGSLFSGIGGIDLGLERAGHTCSWQVEIDPFCRRVLTNRFPGVPCYEDVRAVSSSNLAPIDLLVGGFPCQPVSTAGMRRGVDDPRWLWPEFYRLIKELDPKYVFIENVRGLLSKGLNLVLADLAEYGYDAEWACVPASAFGAPHQRVRLSLVAYPTGEGLEGRLTTPPTRQAQCILPNQLGRAGLAWPNAPVDDRMGYGIPDWVDRVRSLGNAVVPDFAEWVGRTLV